MVTVAIPGVIRICYTASALEAGARLLTMLHMLWMGFSPDGMRRRVESIINCFIDRFHNV